MDHSQHDHHAHMGHTMDHSGHGGHGGMPGMEDMCNMNMIFTWDYNNLCIVFKQWHIRSTTGLVISLLAIVAIGAGYEALREAIRRYEHAVNKRVDAVPHSTIRGELDPDEDESVTESTMRWAGQNKTDVSRRAHIIKAILYGIQNFYAFMIMLVFMTYNGWVMIAVSVGAAVGYLVFGGSTPVTKETACH